MAKILIAGIGGGEKRDGKYRETNYSLEGKVYENRSFIASVIEEHFKIDKTIFIGTVGSMWDNLYEYYCKKYNIDYDEEYAMSLFETIVEANKDMDISQLKIEKFNNIFNGKIEGRVTKYGVDSEQIFDNFNIILNLQDTLKDGDEVYIDITHSFRSNAMWMFLVMNFITDLMDKNIEIKMISYGMFEIADRTSNITPIIDLNAFYKLLKWIKGAQSFKNYGNSYLLLDNIENEELRKKLKTFSHAMNLNYIGTLKQNLNSLKKLLPEIDEMKGPGKLLIPQIVREFVKEFDGVKKDFILQVRLAKWHYKQSRYAMAYININEAIKGYVADELREFYPNKSEEELLDYARKWFFKLEPRVSRPNFKKDNENKKIIEYYKIFDHSRRVRNDIAHSLGQKDSAINDIISLENYCAKLEDMLSKEGFIYNWELDNNILEK
ncbi:TIGR02221 family CRISPR-associated protein [Fusobacterium sp.]|uniref:TIGR02221 family CRISPR-associated protein n=2 Tax=Fusobacterium TaxID=848 RepID=UPI001DE7C9F1|nr:TIGR02221 family CRISPR-associated protein [Fusobacterium sp.]MBS5791104.1 TIGR02221 family CRISPR-associated protein [Fusobacterium sp.]MDY3059170.1 TIGR02221 family CRISPR-associated protein [Fusobacterium sp.]MEE1476841.1 TIGR02221 family CRISPR-associated protein [Fusobacterium sp.]